MNEIATRARTATIEDGVATLEDGTTVNLAPIQEYLAGCFHTTGYRPYASMADDLTRLTGIDWRTP